MYYSINDASYWYEVHGKGTPIVMLHGFTGSTATWHYFVRKWDKGFQLILVDLPGHGRTVTSSPKTMEDCCRDLSQLFEMLNLESFHLLGYSMGGRTALSFVMFYPEMIRSLILESASPGLEKELERNARMENDLSLAMRIEQEGVAAFVDYWQEITLFDSQKNLTRSVQKKIRQERLSQSPEGMAASLRYMGTGSQQSWWHLLNQLKMPVLLLVGELDSKFISINKKMQNKIESAKLIVCENAGHAIHVEKPEKFGKLVIGFVT